ncbi:hypothetical protein KJ991_02160 [Patescibacteria group bacterium]|nr:hypothetical protein [Patescibacteria group bacterium]MBU4115654.1 hypothetical protein [Patescibacteria group bacterium]
MSKENIATPANILGTTAKFFRLMEKEGVFLKDFQQIIDNKSVRQKFIIFVKDISIQSKNIFAQTPLLEKYYQEVYGITLDLSEIVFPEHPDFPAIMVDDLSQNEDEIMECIQKFFNKPGAPVNLYKYKNPVAENIDRKSEELQVRQLQSGLVVFAHTGQDEPDDKHRKKSYSMAIVEKLMFAKYREYLRMTGFHKFIKGYFMDKNGWTRTSSLWADGYLVVGYWVDDNAELYADSGHVDYTHPSDGPRQLFLSLP